jgi:hypothetical protein
MGALPSKPAGAEHEYARLVAHAPLSHAGIVYAELLGKLSRFCDDKAPDAVALAAHSARQHIDTARFRAAQHELGVVDPGAPRPADAVVALHAVDADALPLYWVALMPARTLHLTVLDDASAPACPGGFWSVLALLLGLQTAGLRKIRIDLTEAPPAVADWLIADAVAAYRGQRRAADTVYAGVLALLAAEFGRRAVAADAPRAWRLTIDPDAIVFDAAASRR